MMDRFTISSKPVLVSAIHAGVFVPESDTEESRTRFTFSSTLNTNIRLKYWDENAYLSEFRNPRQPSEMMYLNSLHSRILDTATALPEVSKPTIESEAKRHRKRKGEDEGIDKSKPQVMASQLEFWSNRRNELHEGGVKDTNQAAQILPDEMTQTTSRSYADLSRNCCLLCSRQFKKAVEVNKHEELSRLHRDNLKNAALVQRALKKLGEDPSLSTADEALYRDRARERRITFKAQNITAAAGVNLIGPVPQSMTAEPAVIIQSRGAALLGKMGWSEGKGLGAEGAGITSAITTDVYATRVGLGAQGGRMGDVLETVKDDAQGKRSNFLVKTKQKAKERFDTM